MSDKPSEHAMDFATTFCDSVAREHGEFDDTPENLAEAVDSYFPGYGALLKFVADFVARDCQCHGATKGEAQSALAAAGEEAG